MRLLQGATARRRRVRHPQRANFPGPNELLARLLALELHEPLVSRGQGQAHFGAVARGGARRLVEPERVPKPRLRPTSAWHVPPEGLRPLIQNPKQQAKNWF